MMDHMSDKSKFEIEQRELARKLRRSPWWKNIRGKGLCHYCENTFPPDQITMDHIIPVSAGGRSVKTNIVPACKACNTQKSDSDPLADLFEKIKET
jgi:5-methylcytosine-specific restriction endonuclease McrA